MRQARVLAALFALAAGAALAEAPAGSLRPEARAAQLTAAPTAVSPAASTAVLPPATAKGAAQGVAAPARLGTRPAGRPGAAPGPVPAGPGAGATRLAVTVALSPQERPAGLSPPVPVALPAPSRQGGAPGQVCGNPLIQGTAEASFGEAHGCGIEDPVRVRAVGGVSLSQPALMDCGTAAALLTWTVRAREAVGGRHGGLARIDTMGDYACRPRNNQAGQRLSEHGHGRAVDVGGITFADGTRLTVLGDWPDRTLRALHEAACGPFATVLGPEANRLHRDHLHLDTAPGRGPYCR